MLNKKERNNYEQIQLNFLYHLLKLLLIDSKIYLV